MKNLFDPITLDEVQARLALLRPDSQRMWGKMNPAQAVAHCASTMEWAVGDKRPPRMVVGRMLGAIVKPSVFKDDEPMRRNSSTTKDLIVNDDRSLDVERARLRGLMNRFAKGGPPACTAQPHSFLSAHARAVANPDVQTPGPSSAAVWSLSGQSTPDEIHRGAPAAPSYVDHAVYSGLLWGNRSRNSGRRARPFTSRPSAAR
jgi:hypothetical protein